MKINPTVLDSWTDFFRFNLLKRSALSPLAWAAAAACLILVSPTFGQEKPTRPKSAGTAGTVEKLKKDVAGVDVSSFQDVRKVRKKIGHESEMASRDMRSLERSVRALEEKRNRMRGHLERYNGLEEGAVEKSDLNYIQKSAELERLKGELNALKKKENSPVPSKDVLALEEKVNQVRKERDASGRKEADWWHKLQDAEEKRNESTVKTGPFNLVDISDVPKGDQISLSDYADKKKAMEKAIAEKKAAVEQMRALSKKLIADAKKAQEEAEAKGEKKPAPASEPKKEEPKLTPPPDLNPGDISSNLTSNDDSGQISALADSPVQFNDDWKRHMFDDPDKTAWVNELEKALAEDDVADIEETRARKELRELYDLSVKIREKLAALSRLNGDFMYNRNPDLVNQYVREIHPSTSFGMLKSYHDRWLDWSTAFILPRQEWASRNFYIAQRNEEILFDAVHGTTAGIRVYRDKQDRSTEELTPETAARLKREFVRFMLRMTCVQEHQEDGFQALADVVKYQSTRAVLAQDKIRHDSSGVTYYMSTGKAMPASLKVHQDALSQICSRRIALQEGFEEEAWNRKNNNVERLNHYTQKRLDLPELGKIKPLALVVVGNITEKKRESGWDIIPYVDREYTRKENIHYKTAAEARQDLENRGYQVRDLRLQGTTKALAYAQQTALERVLRDTDLRAVVIIAHGTKTHNEAGDEVDPGIEIATKIVQPDGSILQRGLSPGILAHARRDMPPVDIFILHACYQDSGERGSKWKTQMGLAGDGYFKSWDYAVTPSEAYEWQKKWK